MTASDPQPARRRGRRADRTWQRNRSQVAEELLGEIAYLIAMRPGVSIRCICSRLWQMFSD